MRRWLMHIVSATSLLLLLACAALWTTSLYRGYIVDAGKHVQDGDDWIGWSQHWVLYRGAIGAQISRTQRAGFMIPNLVPRDK
jgi:hypothetical protein